MEEKHRKMDSLVGKVAKKNAMWLYPKALGFNPSETWGHSACFSNGLMYVFGGCCGGLHFSDVLTLDLDKMVWSKLATTGEKPGPRDSHSAVIVGHKMIVFGGTNGFKKVNEIHMLDLVTKEWIRPECKGTPPSPRESHTATLVGHGKLAIFGGSGEGNGNYLNDLHVLDLQTMRWTCPRLKGDFPVPRDSHSTVAIGNKLFVFGGDSGDQYHGDVDMLDMETMTWSRLSIQGSSPGARAGHAAVNTGTKVYIIGGVGDKRYYNDVWILDIYTCSWTQLDICGHLPQGRFSHTAVVVDMDITIYGGCGEDERPLNELVVLQHGTEYPNGRYNTSMCKVFGTNWNQEKKSIPGVVYTDSKSTLVRTNAEVVGKGACEVVADIALPYHFDSGTSQQKRRRIAAGKVWDLDSEQEEHSLSLSQHSSPSQSDQEQTLGPKAHGSAMDLQQSLMFKQMNRIPTSCQYNNGSSNERAMKSIPQGSPKNLHFLVNRPKQEQHVHGHEDRRAAQHMIGAEVRGKIDGAFDSGLLMTAAVNGSIFRGILFAPQGEGVVSSVEPSCCLTSSFMNSKHVDNNLKASSISVATCLRADLCRWSNQQPLVASSPFGITRGTRSVSEEHKTRSDLEGLVLTLGGAAGGILK